MQPQWQIIQVGWEDVYDCLYHIPVISSVSRSIQITGYGRGLQQTSMKTLQDQQAQIG